MNNRNKYLNKIINKYTISIAAAAGFMASAYYYPAETFIVSTVGWLFAVPAIFAIYMGHGYIKYAKERKNRIIVQTIPNEAMRSFARREAQLNREKEILLYEK
jgi:hypothetical protein